MLNLLPGERYMSTADSPPQILQAIDGLLELVPVGIYVCGPDGAVVYHNAAAAELWGRAVPLGDPDERYCGAHRLLAPDGTAWPRERAPAAVALRERRALRGVEGSIERPDGSVLPVLFYTTPVFDKLGDLLGAVNVVVDVADRRAAEKATQRLAAIVDSSEDAIIALDHAGIITSWNKGAERLYQYTDAEVVGRSVGLLIPPDRENEEVDILHRVLRGERVERYETVRLRRDGTPMDISLSVSPVLGPRGEIAGVSKIARDVTERKRAAERRDLLLAEMNHRVKNLLVMASGIVTLSARSASSVKDLASDVSSRLAALARAHELTLPARSHPLPGHNAPVSLHALIDTILRPFDLTDADGRRRISVAGPDIHIAVGAQLTGMALLLHEFATNAAKHGAFASPAGTVAVECAEEGGRFVVTWTERGGPVIRDPGDDTGFGSKLVDLTVNRQLAGEIAREWHAEGLRLRLAVARDRLTA